MVDCKTCKGRFRADNLATSPCKEKPSVCAGQSPKCELTEPREFNLMLQTNFGATGDQIAYLRPGDRAVDLRANTRTCSIPTG